MWVRLLVAVGLGLLLGLALGPRAALFGQVALLFVKLLKLLATPLVFAAIAESCAAMALPGRRALLLLPLSALNAIVAAALAIAVAHLFPLGNFVSVAELRRLIVPKQLPPPLIKALGQALDHLLVENLLWVVAAAILVGLVARQLSSAAPRRLLHGAFLVLLRLLGGVVALVPLVAGAVVASAVGTSGFAIFPLLGVLVFVVALGMVLQVFGWYSLLLLLAGVVPRRFFATAAPVFGTSLGVGSSLATLPVTLRTLEEELGVSPAAARLAAVVGTNLNHDGIVLYEAAAALFVAQLYGVALGGWQQLKLVGLAIMAAIGIAGVPEAGLVTLSLVLGRVGLPLAAVPLLLPVDWLIGRLRATTNVASDMVVALLLDRLGRGHQVGACVVGSNQTRAAGTETHSSAGQ